MTSNQGNHKKEEHLEASVSKQTTIRTTDAMTEGNESLLYRIIRTVCVCSEGSDCTSSWVV